MPTATPIVLFVCVRNAGRSQMAEAIFNRALGGRAIARSAGSHPAETVHPVVVDALAEIGIDLAAARPKGLSADVTRDVTTVVTMGCGDDCPVIPGARVVDWEISDPSGQSLLVVRTIRDQIARLINDLSGDLGL